MSLCVGNDLACPCQDGDACHYVDLPGSPAWPLPRPFMGRHVRVNYPGDGAWIMDRVGGRFIPGYDHSLANHDGLGIILGGFVFNNYMGNSIFVHDAGAVKHWCSRELLRMIFAYAFHQLGVAKVYASVAQDNPHALQLDLRAGFRLEGRLGDAVAPGVDMLILSMTENTCPWLRQRQKHYSGETTEKVTLADG